MTGLSSLLHSGVVPHPFGSTNRLTQDNRVLKFVEPWGNRIYRSVYIGFSCYGEKPCKLLNNLVGLPRFELGTSCTPSKPRQNQPLETKGLSDG
jgi:hypothetical protein